MQWETTITDGTKGKEGKKKSILTYAKLALIFLSESYTVRSFLAFLALVSFDFMCSSPSRPRGRDHLRKKKAGSVGVGVGVGGGQDSDYSLSRPLSGNRKATRSDFKAAVLAAIPALTLLDPSAHTPAAPFLRRSAVPVPPLPRSFLLF